MRKNFFNSSSIDLFSPKEAKKNKWKYEKEEKRKSRIFLWKIVEGNIDWNFSRYEKLQFGIINLFKWKWLCEERRRTRKHFGLTSNERVHSHNRHISNFAGKFIYFSSDELSLRFLFIPYRNRRFCSFLSTFSLHQDDHQELSRRSRLPTHSRAADNPLFRESIPSSFSVYN